MGERSLARALATLTLAAAALAGACSSSSSPTGVATNLTGTYRLISIALPGQPALPDTTGSLVMTASTYTVTITIPIQPPLVLSDSGTYRTTGDSIYETSQVPAALCAQPFGTFTVKADTLSETTSCFSQLTTTVWHKTA